MNLVTLKVLEVEYRIDKLPALTQLHVSRRILPALVATGIRATELAKLPDDEDPGFAHLMEPAVKIMGIMSDEDVDYVLFNCLSAVRRKQGTDRWAPIVNGKHLIFQDIEMPSMIRLAAAVIQENLGGFFALLPGVNLSPESSTPPAEAPASI